MFQEGVWYISTGLNRNISAFSQTKVGVGVRQNEPTYWFYLVMRSHNKMNLFKIDNHMDWLTGSLTLFSTLAIVINDLSATSGNQ